MDRKFTNLVETLTSISSQKEMAGFLYGILTPREIEEISTRLEVVKLLKKGLPQHEIASKLKIGVATVTRGSKEIAKGRFATVRPSGWRNTNTRG